MVQLLTSVAAKDLAEAKLFSFEICASEALTNVVKHANANKGAASTDLLLGVSKGMVMLEIYDAVGAPAFDPRQNARDLAFVDVMQESGRGLGIIQMMADAVYYGEVAGRNRLALGFKVKTDE